MTTAHLLLLLSFHCENGKVDWSCIKIVSFNSPNIYWVCVIISQTANPESSWEGFLMSHVLNKELHFHKMLYSNRNKTVKVKDHFSSHCGLCLYCLRQSTPFLCVSLKNSSAHGGHSVAWVHSMPADGSPALVLQHPHAPCDLQNHCEIFQRKLILIHWEKIRQIPTSLIIMILGMFLTLRKHKKSFLLV